MRLFPSRRPNVRKLKRKGDLAGLRRATRYSDFAADRDGTRWDLGVPVRVEAVGALAEFYGPDVAEGLAEGLDDDHPSVRLAAVNGIAGLGVPTAADRLVGGVVRWDGPPDDEAAARSLETLRGWKVEGVSEVFVDALMEEGAPPVELRHRDAFQELLASDPRGELAAGAVANRMIAVLGSEEDDEQRARAETVLGWMGPSAADVVIGAFESGEATPQVVRAAAGLRDSRAVEPLVRLLQHSDEEMRRSAAIALEELNDTRAVPPLLAATQDPTQSVRDAASTALNSMGMAAVIVGLATILRPRDEALEDGMGDTAVLDETGWAGQVMNRLLRHGE